MWANISKINKLVEDFLVLTFQFFFSEPERQFPEKHICLQNKKCEVISVGLGVVMFAMHSLHVEILK